MPARVEVFGLPGIPEIRPGDDLAAAISVAYRAAAPEDGDILVVTSKVVSKAEGRVVAAADREAAIDEQTVRLVATIDHPRGRTRIVENPQGLVLAAAGVDASNVDEGTVLLLPEDPDQSAARLRDAIAAATGARIGVVISDTLGRAWRVGQTDQAIGAAGVLVADDLRGSTDANGRLLEATVTAVGDELASAADLVKGKATGMPVAVVRGLAHLVVDAAPGAAALQRPAQEDLFRLGAAEAWRLGYAAALAGAPPPGGWQLVTPMRGAAGKGRLEAAGVDHDLLARAIALDTLAAVAAAGADRVVVVTSDAVLDDAARAAGATVVADPGAGLAAAIEAGVAATASGDVAVLLGDLPGLDPAELRHALALASRAGRSFVPDADGVGTVLAAATRGLSLEPRFGEASAAAHAAAGFARLDLPADWGLRRDVDVTAHLLGLRDAGRLGPRTAALLAGSGS